MCHLHVRDTKKGGAIWVGKKDGRKKKYWMKRSRVIPIGQKQRICSSSFPMLAERRVDILLAARGVDRVTILAVCPGSLQKKKKVNSGNKMFFGINYEFRVVLNASFLLFLNTEWKKL